MNIIDKIQKRVILESNRYKIKYNYDYWNEHIKYVVKYASILAKKYNADYEIVKIAALLHDIAKIVKIGKDEEHHIIGAKLAGKMLEKYQYDSNKKIKVQNAIRNHSCKATESSIIEDVCLSDADAIATINYPTIFYYLAYGEYRMNYEEGKKYVDDCLNKKYKKISDKTKKIIKIKNKYRIKI